MPLTLVRCKQRKLGAYPESTKTSAISARHERSVVGTSPLVTCGSRRESRGVPNEVLLTVAEEPHHLVLTRGAELPIDVAEDHVRVLFDAHAVTAQPLEWQAHDVAIERNGAIEVIHVLRHLMQTDNVTHDGAR